MSQSPHTIESQAEQRQEINPQNFSDVFQEYHQPIYNYLLRMTQNPTTAEDLTQETFIKAHRGLTTFRGESSLKTWLYRVASNVSFDHFRRQDTSQAQATISLEDVEVDIERFADEPALSPEQLAGQSEMSACVQDFIRQLPSDYRAALVLHDLQEMTNPEIAEVLNVSLETVKIRLHRARNKMRDALNIGCDFTQDERNVLVCERKVEDGDG